MENGSEANGDAAQLHALMADKAKEIFELCDVENKGFLTKNDMLRLESELPLTAQQLEQVFDSLDVAGSGYLTATEFIGGFGSFIGLPAAGSSVSRLPSEVYESNDADDEADDVTNDFDELLKKLGASGVLDNVDIIKSIWTRLHRDQPEILKNFEDFLARMTTALQHVDMDYQALRTKYNSANYNHNEEMQRLYEEMEQQIDNEKERIKNEEKLKEQQFRESVEKDLEEKDRRLQELITKQQQLEQKISQLSTLQAKTKEQNQELIREKEKMEQMLGYTDQLKQSRSPAVGNTHNETQMEHQIRSLASVQIAEWIELERENLIWQIKSLRDTNRQLRDLHDEAQLTRSYRSRVQETCVELSEMLREQSDDMPSDLFSPTGDVTDSGEREQPVGANCSTPITADKVTYNNNRRPTSGADRVFKIVFVGDSGVGKSCFIHQFCSQTFRTSFAATIGVDFQVKTLCVDGQTITLQLWDTAGQERFRSFTRHYFRKADGILVMYDITCPDSFKNIRSWMQNIQDSIEDGAVLVILGNKIDLVDEDGSKRAVETYEGSRLAVEYDALYFETSAKSGYNVDECIYEMIRFLQDREDLHLSESQNCSTVLTSEDAVKPKTGCVTRELCLTL